MPLGTEQLFTVSVLNQFGTALEECEHLFRATRVGDTSLVLDCSGMTDTALIHVLAFDDVNLALGKPATASGAEGEGTSAAKAVDGNLNTRWSSRFQDDEWIAVDLENCYRLTKVRLIWENAYATEYDVQVSHDGEYYTTLKSVTEAKGGTQEVDIRRNGQSVEAQFVRIVCRKRNTGYGSSLWEFEVYGEAVCENEHTPITNNQSEITNHKFIKNGQLFISHGGTIYTVSGLVFLREEER